MAGKPSTKGRKVETLGKGKVTPTQIAFIVDRYLCDNNFSSTRSVFRTEASSLIANSPINEAPKTLLTLGEMLDEYISLKEQKVMLEQERVLMEQEKNRVQMLLHGMQNVMNAFNASGNLSALPAKSAVALAPSQPTYINKPQPGVPSSVQIKSHIHSLPLSSNTNSEGGNFSTSAMNVSDRKRKDTKTDAPLAAKKSRGRSTNKKVSVQGPNVPPQPDNTIDSQVVGPPTSSIRSSPENCVPSGSQAQGSNIAKCLFDQSSLPPTSNSQPPKTPTRRITSSQSGTHISPPEISSVSGCNQEATPTRCTVISTKRVMVSPAKQMAYIEMSHCISPLKTGSDKLGKRDHVRSRLDFGSDMPEGLDKQLSNEVSTSESEKELDMFDIEFPNFDALGIDFSFSEMLNDLEIPCDGIDFSCQPTSSPSIENASGSSPQECNDTNALNELTTVSEVLCEKDLRILGPDCMTAVKSVTKSITVVSPEKKREQSLD
ncbi:uncharacterized protein LOC130976045 isoform X1 [Arachis stenosperma]|uniref:uncharacterized protein LOC130976045 isoform X1 n=1 Tax=Arachis stenosperma TaxID=217475 RepID=UPI000A2C10F8|nr:uncharacterized protein LOC130976045 isoform X1 [Arachis stenosperma]